MKKLMDFINGISGLMLAVFFVFVALDVFCRQVLHTPITWLNEGSTLSFIVMALLASAVGFINDIHYKVTVFSEKTEKKLDKILTVLELVCVIFFGVIMITQGIKYVQYTTKTYSPSLGIRMSYLTSIIPISGVIVLLSVAYRIYKMIISGWNKGDKASQEEEVHS